MTIWDLIDDLSDEQKDLLAFTVGEEQAVAMPGAAQDALKWEDDEFIDVSNELRTLGLGVEDVSGGNEIALTSLGKRVARHVVESRTRGSDRADAVQTALLRWLKDERHGKPDAFFQRGQPDGLAATEDEVYDAADALEHADLVSAAQPKRADGRSVLLTITPAGRAIAISGRPVSVGLRTPSIHNDYSTNTTVGRDAIGIQGGHSNTQNVTVAWERRAEFVQAVDEILDGVPDGEVRRELVDLRDVASDPRSTRSDVHERWTRALSAVGSVAEVAVKLAPLAALVLGVG